jgi:hypothetical protein
MKIINSIKDIYLLDEEDIRRLIKREIGMTANVRPQDVALKLLINAGTGDMEAEADVIRRKVERDLRTGIIKRRDEDKHWASVNLL